MFTYLGVAHMGFPIELPMVMGPYVMYVACVFLWCFPCSVGHL